MAGFGEGLRLERERRGMTLESLCAATKVRQHHLEALEREDFGELPGGVFRRGIVRAYLAAIGLEEHDWMPGFESSLARYSEAHGATTGEDWTTFATNVKRNRIAPSGPSNGLKWAGVVFLLLLLAVAAWAVWTFLLRGKIHLAML